MPVTSQAQRRAMFAAAEGHSNLGIPKSVGQDFTAASKGITGLPERAGKADPPPSRPSSRPSSSLEALTGIPSGRKPIRRGGGRMKKKAPPSPQGHLANLKNAMAAGNHQQAKIHALSLAKALHAMTPKAVSPPQVSTMPDTDEGY